MKMTGSVEKGSRLYCVGVGPGDPELITKKAVRILSEAEVVAFPCTALSEKNSLAFCIAAEACEKLQYKEKLPIYTPMLRSREERMRYHRLAAERIREKLERGRTVAYLTLGDPAIYCTYTQLGRLLAEQGYRTEYVPGVPSFCAAAARLGIPLVDGKESLRVIPAVSDGSQPCGEESLVFMKTGGRMKELKAIGAFKGREVKAVSCCGMEKEAVYEELEEIPDDAGYFTVVIAKRR